MIRPMKFKDVPVVAVKFRKWMEQEQWNHSDYATRYFIDLFGKCYDSKCSYVYVEDGEIEGVCLGYSTANIWNPAEKHFQIIVVYLSQDTNSKLAGGKMLLSAIEAATDSRKYHKVIVSQSEHIVFTNIDYEKRGFSMVEKNYEVELWAA